MQSKKEIVPELLDYASIVVKNNYSCREIRRWLDGKYPIEDFLTALTFVKRGNNDNENYQEVSKEFLKRFYEEIKTWSPRFQFPPTQYQLGNGTLNELDTTKIDEETPQTIPGSWI